LIKIPVEPMGAVRMTGRGKWVKESAKRYLAYKQAIGYHLRTKTDKPTEFAVAVNVTFHMPIPKSKVKKVKPGQPVTVKPDIDNLVKGLFDAANGICWQDDNQVVRCNAEKVYSNEPGIELEVIPVF
jgi:Holliday junction resolvase RusA-like endonuclease